MATLTAREYDGWKAYAAIEPFGEERADLRMGVLASVIANVNRDPKKRKQPFTPNEFMPFHREPELSEEQKAEALAAKMLAMLVPDAAQDEPELISSLRG